MLLRKALAALAVGTTLASGAIGVMATAAHAEPPPFGYTYVRSYFWHADCVTAGNESGRQFLCINGEPEPWGDEYELWFKS